MPAAQIFFDLRLGFPANADGPLLRLLGRFLALVSGMALGPQGDLDRVQGAGFFDMPEAGRDRYAGLAGDHRRAGHLAQQGNRIKNRNYLKIFVFKYLHFLAGNVFESNQP
jgi:hypothetical protein